MGTCAILLEICGLSGGVGPVLVRALRHTHLRRNTPAQRRRDLDTPRQVKEEQVGFLGIVGRSTNFTLNKGRCFHLINLFIGLLASYFILFLFFFKCKEYLPTFVFVHIFSIKKIKVPTAPIL